MYGQTTFKPQFIFPSGQACSVPIENIKLPKYNIDANAATIPPRLRVAYIIPSNRTAQPNAVENIQYMVMFAQAWYKEQMKLNGFGEKTFVYESEPNTNKPKVNIVNTSKTDTYMRGNSNEDALGHAIEEANANGLTVLTQNEVWLLYTESHLMNPNGTILGTNALGGGGSGSSGGVCTVGSDHLSFYTRLTDNTPYNGQIVPSLGPYPMVYETTYSLAEGSTFSGVASSLMGAVCHELGHAFGLPHDYRNDGNRNGNVMYNGLRGIRGSVYPSLYPDEHTRLEYAGALYLNTSQKFNRNNRITSNPIVNITTTSPVSLNNGQLTISFTASDSDTLASATLRFDGNTVSEMKLNSKDISSQFVIPYYDLSSTKEYQVVILDKQGNINDAKVNLAVLQNGSNQAPKPYIETIEHSPKKDATVLMKSSASSDVNDGINNCQVQWDTNNDGIYETGWMNANTDFSTLFPNEGNYLAKLKIKDPSNAEVISTPVSLRISNTSGACRYIMPPIIMADTSNTTIMLSAKGCPGTIKWSDGFAGSQRTIPRTSPTYTAFCELPYECLPTFSTACTPTYSVGCNSFGIGINGVTIGSTVLSSNSGCSPNAYAAFPSPIINLEAGKSYNFTLNYLGNFNGIQVSIWLDWANNGTSIKLFSTNVSAFGTQTGSFTIPASMSSVNGTKLRIVSNFFSTPTEPCGSYGYGEAEDYLVNICSTLNAPTLNLSGTQTLCPNGSINLIASGCSDTIVWSNGSTGSTLTVNLSGTYSASCTNLCGASTPSSQVIITSVPATQELSGIATNGIIQAGQSITSTQTINTGIITSYRAGKSVLLNPTFQIQSGAIFKAEIVGCN